MMDIKIMMKGSVLVQIINHNSKTFVWSKPFRSATRMYAKITKDGIWKHVKNHLSRILKIIFVKSNVIHFPSLLYLIKSVPFM